MSPAAGRGEVEMEEPCDCCGGQPDECKCQWGDATIYDPDGTPTGNTEEYCYAHHDLRPRVCAHCLGPNPTACGGAYHDECLDYLDGLEDKASW